MELDMPIKSYIEANYVEKKKIKDMLRTAQDYELSYKDEVLFRLLQELLENK